MSFKRQVCRQEKSIREIHNPTSTFQLRHSFRLKKNNNNNDNYIKRLKKPRCSCFHVIHFSQIKVGKFINLEKLLLTIHLKLCFAVMRLQRLQFAPSHYLSEYRFKIRPIILVIAP